MSLNRSFSFCLLVLLGAFAAVASADEPKAERTTADLVADLKPSIVVITFTGRDGKQEGLGTGFVVSEDGLIATNFHVIGEGRPISVQFADGTKREVVEIRASDRQLDLAVVKVDQKGLKPLVLGDAEQAKDGQPVVAMGNPRGLKHSVVEGIISGRREIENRPMLQLAMPIEQGNSGGPLVDRDGRVLGIITLKSQITDNLGFAIAVNALKPLLEKPNPVPMSRWLTIGQLNPREWTPLFGANWRRRAGHIVVEGLGQGFGGRSLCLSKQEVPEVPFEVAVEVKFSPEDGAAGLVFHADGHNKHYGFYPTNGSFRLSRFEGPDVFQWQVLKEIRTDAYRPNEWNEVKVRVDKERIVCFVNGTQVIESDDQGLTSGQVGLAKFRHTTAEFRRFRVARELPSMAVNEQTAQRIVELTKDIAPDRAASLSVLQQLTADSKTAGSVLRHQAREWEQRAERLRQLASDVHAQTVQRQLHALLDDKEDAEIDLVAAALWIAALDHEELEVDDYVREIEALTADLRKSFAPDADDATKLQALKKFFFEELGFHGGRLNYYSRSNSHLNEVIDDREGLPITLSILFCDFGRRIGLPIVGVGLPGHFVVRYEPKDGESQLIDVFDGGTNLSKADAEQRVFQATGRPARDEHFATAKPRDILLRVLSNLLRRAQDERDVESMYRYCDTMLSLDPESAERRAMHFELSAFTRRIDQARADAAWLIKFQPPDVNLERVETLLNRLK
jgi:regulator of sirC expression with transglutaminase-like and TPR domain